MFTLKQLRKIGKEQGIKCTSKMNTITLCEKLGLPLVKNEKFEKHHRHTIIKPVRIVFKIVAGDSASHDEEQIEFPSIYNAAKHLNRNPSCITFYIKRNSEISYNGKKYTVERKEL